jgi:hypothetical protein
MSRHTSPARTTAMMCGDTASLVKLLATSARNFMHNRHSHLLLISKGNAMNWIFIHSLYDRVLMVACLWLCTVGWLVLKPDQNYFLSNGDDFIE